MRTGPENQKPERQPSKRLVIRKDLIKKLGREDLERVQGGTIGCCEYWCGRSCMPISWLETLPF